MKEEYNVQKLMDDIAKWSDGIFGKRSPTAPLHHLKKEIKETIDNPYDDEEYADMFMLLLDSYRIKGGNFMDLMKETYKKLEKNKNRNWGKPDKNGVVEHIK